MRFKLLIISIIIIFNLASCSTVQYTADAATPLNDRAYADIGMTSGTDSTWSLFNLWMFGKPDMDEAIKDALEKKGGDALINVTAKQNKLWFFFFSVDTVTVEGKAVKFYVEEKVVPDDTQTE